MFRLVFSFCLFACLGTGARSITISGYVKDGHTGEKLIGATIYSFDYNGTATNNYGFFSLSLPSGIHTLHFSHVGYQSIQIELKVKKDTLLNIGLIANSEIDEVKVIAKNPFRIQSRGNPAMMTIPLKLTGDLPMIMGERDIMKTLQLMPGVHPGSEGNTSLHVRGADGGNNLILIDGVEVFNPNHLLGFFSVFNEDAINNVKLYTSGFPAKYNGRLASVTDIRMKDGNNSTFSTTGSIGLISSKLLIEGPLVKNKLTCMFTGRRTYLDLLAKPLIKRFTDNYDADYYFFDLNGKVKWEINDKSAFHLSGYRGEDNGQITDSFITGSTPPPNEGAYTRNIEQKKFHWGNTLIIARYEHALNEKLFMNLSASSSNYSYLGKNINIDSMIYWNRGNLITRENTYRLLTRSGINENTTSFHGEYFQGDKHSIMFGGNVKWYGISPKVENIGVLHDTTILSRKTDHVILSGYLQDQIKINNAFKLIPGLNVNKMTHFSKKIYFDKRLEIIYQPLEDITTSVSYSETTQYLHLLSLSKISLASDMWLMANDDIEPARAKDISLSIGLVPHTGWNISTSLYYREYEDLLMYKEGASYREKVGSFDELITSGTGMGRGMELLIEKSTGGAKGFISYSLSSAYRKFPGVNNGEKFKSRYNRPHILYIVSTVDLAPKWKFGFVFNLMSGAMETYSHSRYISWFDIGEPLQDNVYHESMSGFDILVYQRNAYRLPLYHRLDLSLSYEFASRFGSHTLNLGLYNAYNAKNPYSMNQVYIFEGYMGNPPVENSYFQINEKVLFPIIPFINYRFKISEL